MTPRNTSTTATLNRDSEFLHDVLTGLSRPAKHLPCKYFYDETGSALFDRICGLAEYYPTRTELAILSRHASEMVGCFGSDAVLVEYGSGSSRKTRLLLDQLRGAYLPVDISREHLLRTVRQLARAYPRLEIVPVWADFTKPFALPRLRATSARRVVYFSGSTIGNFVEEEAVRLLRQIARQVGPGGGLLIGVDLKKEPAILEPAYDDAQGVTAQFNLNVLTRINRELGADFVLNRFRHRAFYNEADGRIEMHLVSLEDQVIRLDGHCFRLGAGETICTEYSHKYDLEQFAHLARSAGLCIQQVWCDDRRLFSVQYAEAV